MSYNKRTWANGNVVGAVDLNRIENGIADIDVDEIRGWGVQETQLFSETVTTTDTGQGYAQGSMAFVATEAPPETLNITFDGIDYTCARNGNITLTYGASSPADFSTYPFVVLIQQSGTSLVTETAGTYTISASSVNIEISDDFNDAVNSCIDSSLSPFLCESGVTPGAEIESAFSNSRISYFWVRGQMFIITKANEVDGVIHFSTIPANSVLTAEIYNGVFNAYIS